jgi:cytochrome c biogenesis protein CcdA
MFKLIGIIVAAMPVLLLLKAIFSVLVKRQPKAFAEFKKQLDYLVWAILFCIGAAIVFSIGRLIYQALS